jgi:pyruvate kinase
MGDLQGPKIRIKRFTGHHVELVDGARFFLDSKLGYEDGTVDGVGVALDTLGYEDGTVDGVGVALDTLHQDVAPGDEMLLNDGMITLRVNRIEGTRIHTKVVTGGILSDHKGINKRGGGLSCRRPR